MISKIIEQVKSWLFGSYIDLGKIAQLKKKGIKPFFVFKPNRQGLR
jgi:hypothetical protein